MFVIYNILEYIYMCVCDLLYLYVCVPENAWNKVVIFAVPDTSHLT